jgi:hypothetical protein
MPKPKPDQVIRHEIVFGRSERELIEGALVAYQVNKVATPLVALISDVSAMTFIFSIIGGYLGIKYVVSPGLNEVGEIYDDFRNQLDAARETGVDLVGIATDPSTYIDGFLEGLDVIFGR